MKKISLLLLVLLSTISLPASILSKDDDTTTERIFGPVEQQAKFPGGFGELLRWISDNLRYPESAQENGVEGKVIVKITIEKDGTVTEARVVRGVNEALDAEAIRLVKMMPKWEPGTINGVPVRTFFTLPVSFRLPR